MHVTCLHRWGVDLVSATFWTTGGKLIVDGSGKLILCDSCPCPGGGHTSPCNGTDPVPGTLVFSMTFNGITHNVNLTWVAGSASCFGGEGWEYTGGDVAYCSDFPSFALAGFGISLCCGIESAGVWSLQVAVKYNGLQDVLVLDSFTVVTTNPVHYTATSTAGNNACGITDGPISISITQP